MEIPQGIETVTVEGGDLKSALAMATQELGADDGYVAHKIDLTHFRSKTGSSVARSTVKIVAWKSEDKVASVAAPAGGSRSRSDDGDRRDRRDRGDRGNRGDRGDRGPRERRDRKDRGGRRDERRASGERRERPERKGAEAAANEASDFAAGWLQKVLEFMDLEGTVTGTGSDERVHLDVKIEGKAGRLIGKRGATLRALRRLMRDALEQRFGEKQLDVDVNDDRPRESRGSRDEGSRDRGGRRERSQHSEDKLRALARRAAEKAIEERRSFTIKLELNSYDRRIVHMEVSEIDGVESQSVESEDDNGRSVKQISVVPTAEA